ncbi:YezD family protein [Thermaerobacillus caldiproteolyticus]|nr:YezD family protein [Anoxybacillus caldiproteolyticus]
MFTKIKEMLDSMKFGSITLVIQDGKIIQLEKNEKVRLR